MECIFFFFFLESGKPTIVQCSLTVESFGNIEEANMVCICIILSFSDYFFNTDFFHDRFDDDDDDDDDDEYCYYY